MRTIVIALALLLLGCASIVSQAAEKIDLTTPYSPVPAVADMEIHSLLLDWRGQGVVIVFGNGDVRKEIAYNGDEALVLLRAINRMNFSGANPGMHKVIMQRVIKDKKLVGTISGTPD